MKRFNMYVVFVSAFCSLLPVLLYSQINTAWVRTYNGPGNYEDDASAIAVDGQGNVYVTGYCTGSGTYEDYATIKYNSAGVQQWLQIYNGSGNDYDQANAIAVDGSGNVYVTGYSNGSAGTADYATIKYNSAGTQQWLVRYNGPGNSNDIANAIAVDSAGNAYVTGTSVGSGTNFDFVTIKYNSTGDTVWVRRYDGPSSSDDGASAIILDGNGNVYVTGHSFEFGMNYDYATIKYNSAGVAQWVRRYNNPGNSWDAASAIAVDNSGNVYVTGISGDNYGWFDYATIKYNSAGETLWVRRYGGPGNQDDHASAIVVDNSGNVYITGFCGIYGPNKDYATIKYDSAGVEQWVQTYDGPGNYEDMASDIALDGSGNVYVTGHSYGSNDSADYATIKYNSSGTQQWLVRYNGPGNNNDIANAIAVDSAGNVFITGASYGSGTSSDYTTIKYVQTPGIEERSPLSADRLSLKVFPNPAKTFFTIRAPLNAQGSMLKMYDVSGKLVKELQSLGVGELKVSLDGIKNGVYFVQVGDKMVKEKLVVTR
jgi:uncharacterized delta-60 repeat protein